jgi:hypothetical protein
MYYHVHLFLKEFGGVRSSSHGCLIVRLADPQETAQPFRGVCLHVIPVKKSRIMRWAGHVARTGEKRDVCRVFGVGNLWDGDHLEDPSVDGRIILRWIFRTWDRGVDWIYLSQDRDRWRALANDGNEFRVCGSVHPTRCNN